MVKEFPVKGSYLILPHSLSLVKLNDFWGIWTILLFTYVYFMCMYAPVCTYVHLNTKVQYDVSNWLEYRPYPKRNVLITGVFLL